MPVSLWEKRVPENPQSEGNYRKFKEEVEFCSTEIKTQGCCSSPALFQGNHAGGNTGRGVCGGDSPSSGIPVLGRVILHGSSPFLQCQTLQREFEQTSRAQAWQRGQGGRGDSTVRACCKVSHSGSGVPCAGGALSGCQLSLHEVHNKLCPPKRSDCTAQQPLTSWGLSQTHWWVVTALPWLSEAAVSLK